MQKYSKNEAIARLTSCAEKYAKELLGCSFLLLFLIANNTVGCVEICFPESAYLHLTGVRLTKAESAGKFFSKCLSGKLSPRDFEFAPDGSTAQKLDVLPSLITKNFSAKMIGDYNSSRPKLYTEKLVGSTKACLGFVLDNTLGKYVPNTLLRADLRDNVLDCKRVVAVLRKNQAQKYYSEITYKVNINWSDLKWPDKYLYLKDLF